MAKVVMYTTEWCPYCRRAEALLRAKGAEIEKIDVDAQPDRRAEMQRRGTGARCRRSGSAPRTSAAATISTSSSGRAGSMRCSRRHSAAAVLAR